MRLNSSTTTPSSHPRTLAATILPAAILAASTIFATPHAALAQCPGSWASGSFSIGNVGMPNTVNAVTTAFDGSIYATGVFPTAGGTAAVNIARWNGLWAAVGTGLNDTGYAALTTAAGDIIIGGQFTSAGGISANRIARWNGSAWSALGTGLNDTVFSLAVKPNGEIVAGGLFTTAGGGAASKIARWNGSTWIPLGSGVDSTVNAVAVLSSGDVVAGGVMLNAGGSAVNHIARFDGSSWLPLSQGGGASNGVDTRVRSLLALDDGSVIVGGLFIIAGNVTANNIARWSPAGGGTWSPMGVGLGGEVWTIRRLTDGTIVAGGDFTFDGSGNGTLNHIARWDGTAWQPMGGPGAAGTNNRVRWITGTTYQSDTVYVGGEFTTAGGTTAVRIAQFNASATPTITTQPAPTSVTCGGTARLVIGTAPAPVAFQWRRNGVNLANGGVVSGATSPTLTISPAAAANAGTYDCVVSWPTAALGGGCSVTSGPALLTATGCCPADFDNNGSINPTDVANFVNAWFTALTNGC